MSLLQSDTSVRTRNIWKIFLFLFLALGSFECIQKPLEPVLPKYKTSLSIPLIDRTYSLSDLARKDTTHWSSGPSGGWIYEPSSFQNAPSYITLPALHPVQGNIIDSVGPIGISVPPLPGVQVSFKDIFGVDPPATPYPGSDGSANIQDTIDNSSALYDFIVFENGRMVLTITNNFPFAVTFSSPGIQILNLDLGGGLVATFTFPGGISAHTSDSATADISGKLMSKNLQMRFTLQTVGINGKTISPGDKLVGSLAIDGGSPGTEAKLDSASIELTQDRTVQSVEDSSAQLDDSTEISDAHFTDGRFQIKIVNDIDADVVVAFELKEFVNVHTGQPFKLTQNGVSMDSVVIPAKRTANNIFTQTVEMKDYELKSQTSSPTKDVHFSLHILTVKTTGQNGPKPVITKNDSVYAALTPQLNDQSPPTTNYVLNDVQGRVRPTHVGISDGTPMHFFDPNTQFAADQVNFDSVTIALNVLCSGLFPTDFQMKVIAFRKGIAGATMDAHDINGGSTLHIQPGKITQIVFSKSNSTIDQFLGSFFTAGNGGLPDSIGVQGTAVINPTSVYSTSAGIGGVADGDSIGTSLDFSFPVRIGIVNGVFLDTVKLGQTNIDQKDLSNIDTGTVSYAIQNDFPFQLGITSTLLNANPIDPSMPDSVLLHLPKADTITVDSSHYFTTGATGNSFTLMSLTPADVAEFNPAQFVVVRIAIKTSGNNGVPAILKQSEQIHIKAFANITFNVDFNKNK